MAHPMIEALLDGRYAHLHGRHACRTLGDRVRDDGGNTTPLMVEVEAGFPGQGLQPAERRSPRNTGATSNSASRGAGAAERAFERLLAGLQSHDAKLGPMMVR